MRLPFPFQPLGRSVAGSSLSAFTIIPTASASKCGGKRSFENPRSGIVAFDSLRELQTSICAELCTDRIGLFPCHPVVHQIARMECTVDRAHRTVDRDPLCPFVSCGLAGAMIGNASHDPCIGSVLHVPPGIRTIVQHDVQRTSGSAHMASISILSRSHHMFRRRRSRMEESDKS
jgi:hypothetical protein